MRLLRHSETGDFSLTKDLVGDDLIPPYAILSHTWGVDTEEVTFEDLTNGTGEGKPGYEKIRFCGVQARRDGLQHFWIDTCCINKSSSAELAEAINSMYSWYHGAVKCYVYLPDVSVNSRTKHGQADEDEVGHETADYADFMEPDQKNEAQGEVVENKSSHLAWIPSFKNCRWFTRGWTLQELIAPKWVEFFSIEGQRLGDKRSLEQQIHEVTGIDVEALRGSSLSQFSIDRRMAWAAQRNTKREEDAAYSLLGLFDIHIPLIYGEGRRNALLRLENAVKESIINRPLTLPRTLFPVDGNAFGLREALIELNYRVWIVNRLSTRWKVVVDYTTLGPEKYLRFGIMDLPQLINYENLAGNCISAYMKFLKQFQTVRSRWFYFEQTTEQIISLAAEYQKHLLEFQSQNISRMDEDILVLLALRCLGISHDIAVAHGYFPGGEMKDEYFKNELFKATEAELDTIPEWHGGGQWLKPSIELWQLPKDYKLPDNKKECINTLPFLLWRTFQIAQKLFLRNRPRDWPALFYTLCMLRLTYESLEYAFKDTLDEPVKQFRNALKSLIRVFLYHCKNLHPLNTDLDIECYSMLVGGEALHVKHYTEMNSIWVQSQRDYDVVENAEHFFEQLSNFLRGFAA